MTLFGKRVCFSVVFILLLVSSSTAQNKTLKPSKDYWDFAEGSRPRIHYIALPNRRRLAAVGDSLYMLDHRNQILWQWDAGGPPLHDLPFVDSQGTIYVIGGDLLWAAIDSRNGKEKWHGTAVGRAAYSQLVPYGRDMYFVVTDMWGYRTSAAMRGMVVNDELTLCRGNSILWTTELPAGATLRVRGRNVTAVVKRKNRTITKRISVPTDLEKPIGKVNALADYN